MREFTSLFSFEMNPSIDILTNKKNFMFNGHVTVYLCFDDVIIEQNTSLF